MGMGLVWISPFRAALAFHTSAAPGRLLLGLCLHMHQGLYYDYMRP